MFTFLLKENDSKLDFFNLLRGTCDDLLYYCCLFLLFLFIKLIRFFVLFFVVSRYERKEIVGNREKKLCNRNQLVLSIV